ncbi:putative Indole-3-glycerol phosphate synthase, chloroplastic [Nannochloris sp. 'desiccata']|nr:hypothetical protein KSW81_003030 [Chlorella desiccata (nom. nud.)]KAH7624854.1 putative Indole-3-glycerol phosphate synthase, chloroplastic [Chlorella desiccata (nom. nud.)]
MPTLSSIGAQRPAIVKHIGTSRRHSMKISAAAASDATEEVVIRRRPPHGIENQACGPVDFKVPMTDDNKPNNILEEIVWHKAVEIEQWRNRVGLPMLMGQAKIAPAARDFIGAIRSASQTTGKPGLIAEVKKASPSKGVIQPNFDPVKIAKAYEAGGAACLSVLTDKKFFQGGFENLQLIRAAGVHCPLLCKEFIVEAYQVYKARASGADAILLIAAVLPNSDMEYLIKVARAINLQCLIEVHTIKELDRILTLPTLEGCMLGINNRNLQNFEIDLANTEMIMSSAQGQKVKDGNILMAGESGIFTPADVARVQAAGCGAILVGESLVKQGDPEAGVKALLEL